MKISNKFETRKYSLSIRLSLYVAFCFYTVVMTDEFLLGRAKHFLNFGCHVGVAL